MRHNGGNPGKACAKPLHRLPRGGIPGVFVLSCVQRQLGDRFKLVRNELAIGWLKVTCDLTGLRTTPNREQKTDDCTDKNGNDDAQDLTRIRSATPSGGETELK
jgi:hypothetical protein